MELEEYLIGSFSFKLKKKVLYKHLQLSENPYGNIHQQTND